MRTILRFPQAPRPEGEFGSAIHETLEWLHRSTRQQQGNIPPESQVLQVFHKRLTTKQFTPHELPLFTERGEIALRAYLEQRRETITPEAVVEHSFRSEGVHIGQAHMAGNIDKLVVNRTARTITIVDYKTGKPHARWTRDVRLHKYRHQLYLYRALVEGSHTFSGYTVEDAYLEFVEPDEDGRIQTLHLDFDAQEFARTKQLARIIWQLTTTMQLPDVSGYSQDMAGVEAFEKDLLAMATNAL